jgi:hypothetical protein
LYHSSFARQTYLHFAIKQRAAARRAAAAPARRLKHLRPLISKHSSTAAKARRQNTRRSRSISAHGAQASASLALRRQSGSGARNNGALAKQAAALRLAAHSLLRKQPALGIGGFCRTTGGAFPRFCGRFFAVKRAQSAPPRKRDAAGHDRR